ncbi:MAG: glycosyltransferase family 4 protein [Nitrosomonadales bacterium]|nr:glycosyltransferase family 4 protein [Nitrosomonadales bacterium]
MISHSFIRREINALERQGVDILRISLNGWDAPLMNEEDREERKLTHYASQGGAFPLLGAMLRMLVTRPGHFLSTLALTLSMARNSERSLPYHLAYLAEACRIVPWMESFGATHLHAHFGTNSAEIAMLANALGGPPYSFTLHGQNELLFGGFAEKSRRAAFVVAISSYGRSQMFRRIRHELWQKIKVVHCGLEASYLDSEPAPVPADMRVVCVGRLCEAKGQLLLIEAVQRLAQKGIRFELVLAGDGEMRADLEALIARYRLEGQVRITGWLSAAQVRDQILEARGMILPSFSEGLPVVIMEAMALRRPVLSTYVAGIPELVQPGKTGWLFPPGSLDDLVEAIEDLLSKSPEELQRMGDAAHLRVLERHSVDTEAAKLAKLFRESRREQAVVA